MHKPYKFIGFGDIHGPKPYKFIGFGDIHGPKHWADLEGLIFIIYISTFFAVGPKNTKCPRMGIRIGLRG